jgi:hypothetical protein
MYFSSTSKFLFVSFFPDSSGLAQRTPKGGELLWLIHLLIAKVKVTQDMIITLPWLGSHTWPWAFPLFWVVASFNRTAGLPSIITFELPVMNAVAPFTAPETTPPAVPDSFPELGPQAEFLWRAGMPAMSSFSAWGWPNAEGTTLG